MKLDAHPVTRDPGSSIIVALFYPLLNHACPPPTTTVGGCIVARMIRGKEISVSLSSPYVGKLGSAADALERNLRGGDARVGLGEVEIRRCRECRLGAITKPMVAVYCIHGPWSPTDTRVVAARRLGVKVETCNLCGTAYRPHADWSTDPDDLRFCGKRCRQRFRDLSHL